MLDKTEAKTAQSGSRVRHINQSTPDLGRSGKIMGTKLKHESAVRHVNGSALYIDDIPPPDETLHAYFGFTEVARGRVLSIDLARVETAPGVVSVLTLDDADGLRDIGAVFPGDPIMLGEGDEVEFCGQVVFAVCATTRQLARRAVKLAKIDYEKLAPDATIEQGWANNNFVRPSHEQKKGDAKSSIKNASDHLSGQLKIGGQEHFYLESQAALCIPTEEGGMHVYTSSQNPAENQKLVAEVLDIPMNLVTAEVRRMGGAFGGKETNSNQWTCIAALLARKTKKPVKVCLARVDDMRSTGKRHHFISRYSVGFDQEGRLEGLDLELAAGCGNSPDLSDAIVDRAMFHADNAYFLPAVKVLGHRVKTNTVSNTAFRGFGGPQGMISIENIMDHIARKVGKDPLDVRKINFYSAEGGRDLTHYGQRIEQHIIPQLVDRLETKSNYRERRSAVIEFNKNNRILKKGLALTPVKFGISFTVQHLNQAGALIHIFTDGSIQLNHGGTEMGQGLHTKISQIVASVFDVDYENVICTATRTDKVPNSSPTAASSSTDLNGMAARRASETIKGRLEEFACKYFKIEEDEIVFSKGSVFVGTKTYSFPEFIQLAYRNRISLSATGHYKTPKIHYDRVKAQGRPFLYYANGAAVSEVILDSLTGEYKLLRVDICQDVGQSINPALDLGQIEGGFIQGMGWLTTEELFWDENGILKTISPAAYKIPAIGDTPAVFNTELLPNSPNLEATVFHSKAVGEPPLMLGISVWSAILDGVSSLADYTACPSLDAPATPERILQACNEMKALKRIA